MSKSDKTIPMTRPMFPSTRTNCRNRRFLISYTEKIYSFGKLIWTIGAQAKYATFHTFPLHTSTSTLQHLENFSQGLIAKIYHFIESKQSSTQNLHVQVIVKWSLNTYVHNQRQYKSKMTKFEYIIPASCGTISSALYKYCKLQKASKLQHTEWNTEVYVPQPYTLKIC